MAGSITKSTAAGTATGDLAGPIDLELKFSMTAPLPVNVPQEDLSETETITGDDDEDDDKPVGGEVETTQAVAKTGIKLRVNFRNNTIKVINPKKRPAFQLDPETLAKYTEEELEVAITLVNMRNGPPAPKRVKTTHTFSRKATTKTATPQPELGDADETNDESDDPIILKSTQATRKQRIVDPTHPADALLILGATKASADIYDSDAEDLAGKVHRSTSSKSKLFRNVQWGPAATDTSNDADFPSEPGFDQFVPGRWERLADGTIKDQKHKLLVRFTTRDGRKVIFKNPPPKDWNNQKAITCLNKRVSQQIRRNTSVRFRPEVESYVHEERVWINEHLTKGKPANGWKAFVAEFNAMFAGQTLEGCEGSRPTRTHSSLTKEVERFGKDYYSKGKVPEIQTRVSKKGKSKDE